LIIPVTPRGRIPAEILSLKDRECHVRGGMLMSHLECVEEGYGGQAVEKLWARMPERLRSVRPETIATTDWISFELLVTADRAIARTFALGHEEELLMELGRFSARRNFGKQRLELAKGMNVHSHFWSGKTHHERFQDFGSCTYVPLEAQAFRMEYRDYRVLSRVFCLSAYGYFEASIELLGGLDPIVEETACQCYGDETCTFVVSWER
jgi:hypothetical protein